MLATLAAAVLTAWFWVDPTSGTLSWADAQEKVPAKYRETAQRVEIGTLADYPRATLVAPAPAPAVAPVLEPAP